MKCPNCKTGSLVADKVADSLKVKRCSNCKGQWISSNDYWNWLDRHEKTPLNEKFTEVEYELEDSTKAKICPDCGRIMIKFKVGHGLNFRLDHCNGCNGVWFDKNEWNVLFDKNLHSEIHSIFTTEWQSQIKREECQAHLEACYREKLGADYDRVSEIKTWIDKHPERTFILSLLSDYSST